MGHPSESVAPGVDLAPFVGVRVRLTMAGKRPWKGVQIVGTIVPGEMPGTWVLEHKAAGDVVLLPGSVVSVKKAPKR